MPLDAIEERRKKTTLRLVKREHAGKVTQPYQILERLIAEVGQFDPLKHAKIVVLWKSGWKPTKDEILKHIQIRKASEAEREIWGDKYELCLMLHRELWQSNAFGEAEREMDIFHELCHVVPEIDDKTGDQKKDDRGRLCWRLRNHPIQRFPEEIERYGYDAVLHLDETARVAADSEASRADAVASENDANRPLLALAGEEGPSKLDLAKLDIEVLAKFTGKPKDAKEKAKIAKQIKALEARFSNVGELVQHMQTQGDWWHRDVPGIGKDSKVPIEDAIAKLDRELSAEKKAAAKKEAKGEKSNPSPTGEPGKPSPGPVDETPVAETNGTATTSPATIPGAW